ncbi:unnamed protein product [Auanema sp. JU1783]|nr:unnamed protein product [Auanema sp. JU1783]
MKEMPRMAENLAGKLTGNFRPSTHHARTGSRTNSIVYSTSGSIPGERKFTIVETESGALELQNDIGFVDIVSGTNMDGVQHLRSDNVVTRNIWRALIIIFILLALIQIWSQLQLYFKYPVATNIEAEYPRTIPFPSVAICNNNRFRLTYITGPRILNRRAKEKDKFKTDITGNSSIFDKVIEQTWDMDAVRFLRSAAHWKSRMILGCTWPNGTSCKLSDFKAVWTMTGLCWAINTDIHNPVEVAGSGATHGLRLLLNVESYERVDACTPHFKSRSISGLKILIFNQTYVPESSLNGVNVPSGYSMDIPFKMQYRNKLPGVHCIEETRDHINARDDFDSEYNVRTCSIRRYLREIENNCNCSMRRAFLPNNDDSYNNCNVDDYFGCVQKTVKAVQEIGSNANCQPPCQVIDYTAWQDMNRMPSNLMPTLIEEHEEEDESDVAQEDIDEDNFLETDQNDDETFSCSDSAYLDEKQVSRIKRDAHRAYEKQARYQENIFLRSKRLILRLSLAIQSISNLKWGWHGNDFKGVYQRLMDNVTCFATFSQRHESIASIMKSRPPLSEEKRASQIHYLLDENSHRQNPFRHKTIGDVKAHYGDRVEVILKEMQNVLQTIELMWQIFEEKTYLSQLTADLSLMDRIVQLMTQYESGKLQRRAWAEKMQSRKMRHFFDEEFYEGYYATIIKDLDQSLVKVIDRLENEEWLTLKKNIENGTALKTGAILFFEDPSEESLKKFQEFLMDVYECSTGEVKTFAHDQLKKFRKAFRELQTAYANLFRKELPDYLENFEFGSKFVGDNFAMVNIFFHRLHMERWSQDQTYSIWSLACDIGGALGLFLGLSLLTLIELIYLLIQHKFFWKNLKNCKITDCFTKDGRKKIFKNSYNMENDDCSQTASISDIIERTMKEQRLIDTSNEQKPKRSIWTNENPYMIVPSDDPEEDEFLMRPDSSVSILDMKEPDELSGFNTSDHLYVDDAVNRLSNIPEENSKLEDISKELAKPISKENSPTEDEHTESISTAPNILFRKTNERQTAL